MRCGSPTHPAAACRASTPPPTRWLPPCASRMWVRAATAHRKSPWRRRGLGGRAHPGGGGADRPATTSVSAIVPVTAGGCGVGAMDDTAVWVAGCSALLGADTLERIDPQANRVVATIELGSVINGAALGAGALWATTVSGDLVHIDPRTNAVLARFSLPDAAAVAIGRDAIWVVNQLERTVGASGPRRDPGGGLPYVLPARVRAEERPSRMPRSCGPLGSPSTHLPRLPASRPLRPSFASPTCRASGS